MISPTIPQQFAALRAGERLNLFALLEGRFVPPSLGQSQAAPLFEKGRKAIDRLASDFERLQQQPIGPVLVQSFDDEGHKIRRRS